jgi:hypothetical protein
MTTLPLTKIESPVVREQVRPAGRRWRLSLRLLRENLLAIVAGVLYLAGVLARWAYVLQTHNPRHYVYTDAKGILDLAIVLANPGLHQDYFHTIWPPGEAAFLALSGVVDPTMGLAAIVQFVLSCACPLFVADTARLAYGRRAGWIALILGSLHFGFVHYGGFFLSEEWFQITVVVAVWATVNTLIADGSVGRGSKVARVAIAVVCGLAWGFACCFRPNALPVALFAASWMALRWVRLRRYQALAGLAGGALGLCLVVAPLTDRCTTLLGKFCVVSSNTAMNVALGHAPPDVMGLRFRPLADARTRATGQYARALGDETVWGPPARMQHGLQGTADVPASIYDTPRIVTWIKGRFLEDPAEFAMATLGNVLDLFGVGSWPDDFSRLPKRWATIVKQIFFGFVVIPGVVIWGLEMKRMFSRRDIGDAGSFFVAVLVGCVLVAAGSLGEPRYRFPFDGVLIAFAAYGYAGRRTTDGVASARNARRRLFVLAGPLAVAIALVVATAHPRVRLAARWFDRVLPGRALVRASVPRPLSDFASRVPEGAPWDAAGAYKFRCTPGCAPLRVDLGGMQTARTVELSADNNDRYEVTFWRGQDAVGRIEWGFEGGAGIHDSRRDVPASAVKAGYDSVIVRPLYGDGRYSFGGIRLL